MAAVWVEPEQKVKSQSLDFRGMLDALPVPVWLRDRALSLVWANRAFVEASGAANADAAISSQISLEKSEHDLAAMARNAGPGP